MKDFKFKLLLILLFVHSGIIYGQSQKKVDIEQAKFLEFNEQIVANAQRLIGDVILRHNNVRMWCDSAYSYTNANIVDAFGNVHILKDDTLHLYADFINYDGDLKWAKARGHVKLINKTTTLTTDSMDFDMEQSIGYYDNHGTIVDSTNTLTSLIGEYYSDLDKAYFKTDVKAVTEDYTLTSDTLIYYTETGIASIVGPTMINDEENTLYAEDGFYNSRNGEVELYKNPLINTPEQNIKADSIFYNRETGDGLAIGNADIHDIENKMIVRGNKIEYNDQTETALVTDSAHFLLYSEKDTLFLHADTLKTIPDTILDEKLILAYYKVKFFRESMQGKCDSMVYWSKDSTVQLYKSPVIWSGNNQMTADYIEMITQSDGPDLVKMESQAFIVAMEDSTKFNQIKGRDMLGYIRNNELFKIDVDGNGQSIYYARDKKGIIGLNKAESSNIQIFLEESKVKKIAFITSPEGQLLPLFSVLDDETTLPGFVWYDQIRPKRVEDIFREISLPVEKKAENELTKPEIKSELQ
ncbi:OstA-like protein [Sunxiuqinia sp. A32]|uniref:OstA-like protein n=1 Tax=Sunxiuqinia sp. A32 TaxID=3461496 RepID=UPI00404658DF